MSIRKVINKVNWEFFLSNKNVHDQVSAFNSTSVNFFFKLYSNQIPNFNEKYHPWMTGKIKNNFAQKTVYMNMEL